CRRLKTAKLALVAYYNPGRCRYGRGWGWCHFSPTKPVDIFMLPTIDAVKKYSEALKAMKHFIAAWAYREPPLLEYVRYYYLARVPDALSNCEWLSDDVCVLIF
ncbi:MAG: hypothetical protein QXT13_12800, partial [Pyrobaculum sp.]